MVVTSDPTPFQLFSYYSSIIIKAYSYNILVFMEPDDSMLRQLI